MHHGLTREKQETHRVCKKTLKLNEISGKFAKVGRENNNFPEIEENVLKQQNRGKCKILSQ